jgi:hypothetical protein
MQTTLFLGRMHGGVVPGGGAPVGCRLRRRNYCAFHKLRLFVWKTTKTILIRNSFHANDQIFTGCRTKKVLDMGLKPPAAGFIYWIDDIYWITTIYCIICHKVIKLQEMLLVFSVYGILNHYRCGTCWQLLCDHSKTSELIDRRDGMLVVPQRTKYTSRWCHARPLTSVTLDNCHPWQLSPTERWRSNGRTYILQTKA